MSPTEELFRKELFKKLNTDLSDNLDELKDNVEYRKFYILHIGELITEINGELYTKLWEGIIK